MRILLQDENGQIIAFAENMTIGNLAAIPWIDNDSSELYAEGAGEG